VSLAAILFSLSSVLRIRDFKIIIIFSGLNTALQNLFHCHLHKYFKGNRFESRFGDADGDEFICREEEFGKMERLEKKVLDYPRLVFSFLVLFSKNCRFISDSDF
jgi:hypothetical protein